MVKLNKKTKQLDALDIKTQRPTHRIDLTPAKQGRANMFYCGEHIGVSCEPLFTSARWLLKHSKADAKHVVETHWGSAHRG